MLLGDVMPYFTSNAQAFNWFAPNALPANITEFNCSQVMDLPTGRYDQGSSRDANGFGSMGGQAGQGSGPVTDSHGNPGSGWNNSIVGMNSSGALKQNGLHFGMPMPGANILEGTGRAFYQENSSVEINASAAIAIGKACDVDTIGVKLQAPVNDIEISGIGSKAYDWADSQDGLSARFAFMHPVGVSFSVGDNATLSLQLPMKGYNQTAPVTGYVLAPGAAVTFSYEGKLEVGRGTPYASLNDSSYVLTVMTSKGIVQANVTAS